MRALAWILAIFCQPACYWHLHHLELIEVATEPIKNRIAYIKKYKPLEEVPLRLKLLKKVRGRLSFKLRYFSWLEKLNASRYRAESLDYELQNPTMYKEIETLHKKECAPDCPWNGRTIFPENMHIL